MSDATPISSAVAPTIATVMRRQGVARTFLLSLVARLPATAIGSLVALKVAGGHN